MDRTKKGIAVSAVMTSANLLLALGKTVIGILTGSISIMSDAVNNYGDVVSSGAMAVSFKMSGKKADRDHPFGHGRIEYVTAFVIAVVIIVAGGEFLISSVKQIINPAPIRFDWLMFGIIAGSIAVKAFMAVFYHIQWKKLESLALKAGKADSLQDCFITAAALVSFGVSQITDFPADAVAGAAISVFVLFSGIKLIRETINVILGKRLNPALSSKILARIMREPLVLGAHDLILHDYGPGNVLASVHAELSGELTLSEAHDIADALEKRIMDEFNIDLVVHIDPTCKQDSEVSRLRSILKKSLENISPKLSYHDFYLSEEELLIRVDISIPYECNVSEEIIDKRLKECDWDGYVLVCKYDHY